MSIMATPEARKKHPSLKAAPSRPSSKVSIIKSEPEEKGKSSKATRGRHNKAPVIKKETKQAYRDLKESPSTKIEICRNNPKRPGSLAYERFEKYKMAQSISEMLESGGSLDDLMNDLCKGFLKAAGAVDNKDKEIEEESLRFEEIEEDKAEGEHKPEEEASCQWLWQQLDDKCKQLDDKCAANKLQATKISQLSCEVMDLKQKVQGLTTQLNNMEGMRDVVGTALATGSMPPPEVMRRLRVKPNTPNHTR